MSCPPAAEVPLTGSPSEVVNLLSSDEEDSPKQQQSAAATSSSGKHGEGSDSDVEMVGAPPAITNYPHARFNCLVHPFKRESSKADKIRTCDNCYCFVCDILASDCPAWSHHCCAENTKDWQDKRHNIHWQTEGHAFVGKRVRQHFTGHGFTLGTITKWVPKDGKDPAMFHVVHDDGDEEDLSEKGSAAGIRAFDLMIAKKNRIRGARREVKAASASSSSSSSSSSRHGDSDLSSSGSVDDDASDSDSDFIGMDEDMSSESESESESDKRQRESVVSIGRKSKRRKKTRQNKKQNKKKKNNNNKKKKKQNKQKKNKQKKKKTNSHGSRAKRMSVSDINHFLWRLVYCLEKGKVNMDEHPHHDVLVRRCVESQRDEFAIAPNTKCVVLGLTSDKGKQLNGKCGVVVYLDITTHSISSTPRYVVRLTQGGSWHRLRPGNVKQIPSRGVTIVNVKSKPELNGRQADVMSWRSDGKFVVKMLTTTGLVAKGADGEVEEKYTFLALKPEFCILPPGTAVVLHSLKSKAELNGIRGCLVTFQKESGRYVVRIPDHTASSSASSADADSMKTVAVKPANIWS